VSAYNVYYLWLCLEGTSASPVEAPPLPIIPGNDDSLEGRDCSVGGGMTPTSNMGLGDDHPNPKRENQREQRHRSFESNMSLPNQQLAQLKGSTLGQHQCQRCLSSASCATVLYCDDCESALCTACDHCVHKFAPLHRRHTLFSGLKLATLETVELHGPNNVRLSHRSL